MKSIITKDFGITNSKNFEQMITLPLANVFIMMGRAGAWPNTSNSQVFDDSSIPEPYDTTDFRNSVARTGILLKKITNSDIQAVVPRIDWVSGNVYVAYDQTLNLFSHTADTLVAGGNVNVSVLSLQTVNSASINLAASNPALSVGSFIKIGEETKEVVSINAAGDYVTVNTPFSSAYTQNSLFKIVDNDPYYANQFYVRNNVDQVFKCMYNNGGANSTIMPEIGLGGQLPENPFIDTSDGYKWKYMYTISTGVKNKFFTDKYMPVIKDQVVYDSAVNGRIDVIEILDGGAGYFNGSSVNNYAILTVDGDGSGANVTADIVNGEIVNINILDGGSDYTTATVTVDDPLQLTTLANTANLRVVISPQFGHGFDPIRELGASDQMISVDFVGDVDGYMPTQSDGTDKIREVALIKDPKYAANNIYATGSIYPMYTKIYTSNPPVDFEHNALIYAGSSYETSTFSAYVVHFDNDTNILYVNRITGNVDSIVQTTIYQQDNPSASARVFTVEKPDINIFTGELLYVQNRAPITRSLEQTETLKLVVEF